MSDITEVFGKVDERTFSRDLNELVDADIPQAEGEKEVGSIY